MAPTKLLFGAGTFVPDFGFKTAEDTRPWLNALLESKDLLTGIDTSSLYNTSEEYLGALEFGSHFAISTKLPGQAQPTQLATKENVIAQAKERLSKLRLEKIDVLFMHTPDTRVPLEDTLSGIDALYKEGVFNRFGLSNYFPEQVEEVLKVCDEKGFVRPTVFEGSYSAFSRLAEDKLLPILRKNKMSFWAYSPIAGGFLSKTSEQFRENAFEGRWSKDGFLGKVYQYMFNRPEALEALDKWHQIAAEEGVSPVEMAFRWVVHNSALDGSLGDGIIIGASTIEQWKSNLVAIAKGPLSAETAAKIDALWPPLREGSTYCNWEVVAQMMDALRKAAGGK